MTKKQTQGKTINNLIVSMYFKLLEIEERCKDMQNKIEELNIKVSDNNETRVRQWLRQSSD